MVDGPAAAGAPSNPPAPAASAEPARDAASVSTDGLSDAPAEHDQIGFAPHVRAVCRFLASEQTKAPLTMSIEGRWGSGKSSFMLQLASMLRATEDEARAAAGSAAGPTKQTSLAGRVRAALANRFRPGPPTPRSGRYTVWFNAWRFDKDESLWASFALVLIQQLSEQIPPWRRVRANVLLTLRRFDIDSAKWTLLQLAAFAVAFGVFWMVALGDPKSVADKLMAAPKDPKVIGTGALALAAWAYSQAKKLFGNPLERDLKKFVRDPGYRDKLPFAERFQDDFARILGSYVGSDRVYIFIDDLDRAEVPRAADLMQAINMLMSVDHQVRTRHGAIEQAPTQLYFVLGIDRQVIAAGIAAKHEKLVPYIANARSATTPEIGTLARLGVDYGYEFLEKFIQVTFRVPQLEAARVGSWVSSLTGEAPGLSAGVGEPAPAVPVGSESARNAMSFNFSAGADPEGFATLVARVTGELGFNPRKIKQFVNVLRLQVLVLIETGGLIPAQFTDGPSRTPGGLTLEKIALASAVLMKWPVLVRDLAADPRLLSRLSYPEGAADRPDASHGNEAEKFWRPNLALAAALRIGGAYSLAEADLRPLLELVPDARSGPATWVGVRGRPGRLVPQQATENEGSSSDGPSSAPSSLRASA